MKLVHKTIRVMEEDITIIQELADLHGVGEAHIVRVVLLLGLNELYDVESTSHIVLNVDTISRITRCNQAKDAGDISPEKALEYAKKREAKLQRVLNELKRP